MQREDTPYGYCQCDCGQKTRLAPYSDRKRGWVHREPVRFLPGHNMRWTNVEYVVDENGCWVWQLGKFYNGYGQIRRAGRLRRAHRVYYERHVGAIPEGLELDHLCRNRACVNPAHMEPVTHAENMQRGKTTKLTVAQVREIRGASGRHKDIGARYGVRAGTVGRIKRGQSWRNVGMTTDA